jgi:hypothetical protein
MNKTLSILVSVLFAFAASAQTRLTPAFVTNVVTSQLVTAAANSNILSAPLAVNPGYGIGLAVKMHNASTSATTNAGVYINITPDGTNWPSPAAYLVAIPHVANTTNFWYTNLPSAWFDGGMSVRVESLTNNDNANTVTFDQLELSRRRLDYQ